MTRLVFPSAELRSKCRKYKLEHNLGIIMIDYLQLMTGQPQDRNPVSRKFRIFPGP